MNAPSVAPELLRCGAALGLEVLAVFAAAKLACGRMRSAQWQRTVWQAAVIAVLLCLAGEMNGVRAFLSSRPMGRATVVAPRPPADAFAAPEAVLLPAQAALHDSESAEAAVPAAEDRWPSVAAWLWAAGSVLLLGRLGLGFAFTTLFRISAPPASDSAVSATISRLCAALRLRSHPAVIRTRRVTAPFTFGILRPVIVLPVDFEDTFSVEHQDLALLHELAHIAAGDAAWRFLSNLLSALLWWHPGAWLLRRELLHASEAAADEASTLVANGPARLAECLSACAQRISARRHPAWIGMGDFRSGVGKRIERLTQLAGPPATPSRPLSRCVKFAAPALFVLLLWLGAGIESTSGPAAWRRSPVGTLWTAAANAAEIPRRPGTNAAVVPSKEEPSHPPAEVKSAAAPAPSKEDIHSTLRRIRLAEVLYDRLPLSEVVKTLQEETRKWDPQHQGISFLIRSPATVDGSSVDVNAASVSIRSPLRNLTLEQVLNAITASSSPLLKWSVNDSVVVISAAADDAVPPKRPEGPAPGAAPAIPSPAPRAAAAAAPEPQGPALVSRIFRIDLPTVVQGLKTTVTHDLKSGRNTPLLAGSRDGESVARDLQSFFKTSGVDMSAEGRSVVYNDRTGVLMVRATAADMALIENAVQILNMAPPQIEIAVKAMEVPSHALRDGSLPLPALSEIARSVGPAAAVTNRAAPTTAAVITPAQFQQVLRAVEKVGGLDVLSCPSVTTLSGRQAQIKVVDIRYIVTDLDYNHAPATNSKSWWPFGRKSNPDIMPIAQPFEIGPVIDVVPYVAADGYTIQLTVLPTLREFLGYDDPGAFKASFRGTVAPQPLPKFRLRQVATTARVWDGQTLVVGGGQAKDTRGLIREVLYFITPRLIDPAGNPIHFHDELEAGLSPRK